MAQPLVRPLRTAADGHGESGLEGWSCPSRRAVPVDEHSVDRMLRLLSDTRDAAETIEVAVTGPLTNVAVVLRRDPTLADVLPRLVIMGSAIDEGNTMPVCAGRVEHPTAGVAAGDAAVDRRSGCRRLCLGLGPTTPPAPPTRYQRRHQPFRSTCVAMARLAT